MSDRERWIVYPLLLFAIVLAVAPKKDPKFIHTRELQCEEITVADANGKKVRIGCAVSPEGSSHTTDAGLIILYGPNEKRILSLGAGPTDAGRLTMFGPDGAPLLDLKQIMRAGVAPTIQLQPTSTEPPPAATEKNEHTQTEPATEP